PEPRALPGLPGLQRGGAAGGLRLQRRRLHGPEGAGARPQGAGLGAGPRADPLGPLRRAAPARRHPALPTGDGRADQDQTGHEPLRLLGSARRPGPRRGARRARGAHGGELRQPGILRGRRPRRAEGAGGELPVPGGEGRRGQDHVLLRQEGARPDGPLRHRQPHRARGRPSRLRPRGLPFPARALHRRGPCLRPAAAAAGRPNQSRGQGPADRGGLSMAVDYHLEGQAAVITGSTSGIDEALATALAEQGVNVVLNGFGDPAKIEADRAAIQKKTNAAVRYHGADMTRPGEIADLIAYAHKEFGRLDILVNNAGIQYVAPVDEYPNDKWDALIAVILSSTFHATKHAVPIMKAQGRGRIIN